MRHLTCSLVVLTLSAMISLPAVGQVVRASEFDALRFRSIGPANMSGRLVDIAVVEMDTRVYYLASATGGVWKTTDNGVRFPPVFEGEAVHSVGDVVDRSGTRRRFSGGALVLGPDGDFVARSPSASRRPHMVLADLDLDGVRQLRSQSAISQRRSEVYKRALAI